MIYNSSLGLVGQALAAEFDGRRRSASARASRRGRHTISRCWRRVATGRSAATACWSTSGSQSQSPIPPPNTVVAQQPDQGGGSLTNAISIAGHRVDSDSGAPVPVYTTIGTLQRMGRGLFTAAPSVPGSPPRRSRRRARRHPRRARFRSADRRRWWQPTPSMGPIAAGPTTTTTKHHATGPAREDIRFAVGHRNKLIQRPRQAEATPLAADLVIGRGAECGNTRAGPGPTGDADQARVRFLRRRLSSRELLSSGRSFSGFAQLVSPVRPRSPARLDHLAARLFTTLAFLRSTSSFRDRYRTSRIPGAQLAGIGAGAAAQHREGAAAARASRRKGRRKPRNRRPSGPCAACCCLAGRGLGQAVMKRLVASLGAVAASVAAGFPHDIVMLMYRLPEAV